MEKAEIKLTQDEFIFLAKVCEEAELHEDMVKFMKSAVMTNPKLSLEQRNLLSTSYKTLLKVKQASWGRLASIRDREEDTDTNPLIYQMQKQIEYEIEEICTELVTLIEELLRANQSPADQVFFYKMKGDFCSLWSETADGDFQIILLEISKNAYKLAEEQCDLYMHPCNPIRLGMKYSQCEFMYEVLDEKHEALRKCQRTFYEAIDLIEEVSEADYKEASSILQLMRSEIGNWSLFAESND